MIDIIVPVEGEGTQATVRAWLKQVGDTVAEHEPLVELETDKVAMEVPAPASGVLTQILLLTDSEAVPGAVLGRLSPAGEVKDSGLAEPVDAASVSSAVEKKEEAFDKLGQAGSASGVREMRLSPSVKRACLQHDIDPTRIEGTGRNGRVTRADVDRVVAQATVTHAGPPTTAQPRLENPPSTGIASHSVPHDRMRLKIAENMLRSVTEAPHVTAVFEADFSAIQRHREAHKAAWAKKGVKLTYTAYIVAAAAEAMKVAPAINSRWHPDRLEIFDDINIGVGTALGDKGLIVPVLRQVQRLNLKGIAAGLDDLVERARKEQLTGKDVTGGTFTISNHGVSGSLFASPIIINQPQSAILGIGKLEKRVVVREVDGVDTIQIRPMAYVSLTIDHRVVDGHQTNAWLSRFVELLESWPSE
ncbi:MAG: dihydrolipoamide succinyltransferase [Alphaproteobacteria bacterium]|nr:dihydrolipoamide succinyltransferase [Alphaproteobacteria bacterium]